MTLQPFSFPFPQTRFFKAGTYIYKFKIRGGSSYRAVEATEGHSYNPEHEMENIIRTVLGNLECLQPFTSTHFHVYPYKKAWERVPRVMCKHGEDFKAYRFTLLLYLDKNVHKGSFTRETADRTQEDYEESLYERSPKLQRRDSPLEDAILQDLEKDRAAEIKVSVLRPYEAGLLLQQPSDEDSHHEDKFVDMNSVPDAVEEDDDDDEEDDGEESGGEDSPMQPGMLSTLTRAVL